MGDTPGVWTLTLTGERPMTANWTRGTAKHWSDVASRTADMRRAFWALTKQQAIPHLPVVEFEIIPLHKDLRSPQDTGACSPAAKAAIDGIVCALDGLPWDDRKVNDGPDRVLGVQYRPPACGSGVDGLMIVVRAMTDDHRAGGNTDRTLLVPVSPAVVGMLSLRVGRIDHRAWGVEAGRLLTSAVADAER